MLEEQHRIIRAGGRFQQTLGVLGAARINDVPARGMGENGLDIGGVPGPALDVATTGHPDDQRTGPRIIAAPADGGDFVTQLQKARPDIVGKLNFDNGLVARDRRTGGDAQMLASASAEFWTRSRILRG